MPLFKYADQLATVPECPPTSSVEGGRVGYRFVRSPIGASSFVPVGMMPGRRVNRADYRAACAAYALSMYSSEGKARVRFAELREEFPNFEKTAGSHLAKIAIQEGSGRHTTPTRDGHFDFFEYADCNLTEQSTIVGEL